MSKEDFVKEYSDPAYKAFTESLGTIYEKFKTLNDKIKEQDDKMEKQNDRIKKLEKKVSDIMALIPGRCVVTFCDEPVESLIRCKDHADEQ